MRSGLVSRNALLLAVFTSYHQFNASVSVSLRVSSAGSYFLEYDGRRGLGPVGWAISISD